MTTYGQFCPVAKAVELLGERWTLLVVRELLSGSQRFNDLRRGVPRMSPALLSKRLRTLQRAGVIERDDAGGRVAYALTEAGQALRPVVEAMGCWGARWIPELGDEDLDPHLLLWDMHRNIDLDAVPNERTVLHFRFPEIPRPAAWWWLVIDREVVDVRDVDPGYPATVTVTAPLRTMIDVWRGETSWVEAGRRKLHVDGPEWARRSLPGWLRLSPFASVPRQPRDAAADASSSRAGASPAQHTG